MCNKLVVHVQGWHTHNHNYQQQRKQQQWTEMGDDVDASEQKRTVAEIEREGSEPKLVEELNS